MNPFRSFLENNRQYWDYVDESLLREKRGKCRVTFYLAESPSAAAQVREIARQNIEDIKNSNRRDFRF